MTAANMYLVVSDSFKGALSSIEAGQAIADGIRMADEGALVRVLPAADGGEGSAEALGKSLSGQACIAPSVDPFGFSIDVVYYDLGTKNGVRSAVFDAASCAGLGFAKLHGLDPLVASTAGVGKMLVYLRSRGFHRILLGLGGSGTNDGGIGALAAMGAVKMARPGCFLRKRAPLRKPWKSWKTACGSTRLCYRCGIRQSIR